MDPGRKADMHLIEKKLQDNNLTKHQRNMLLKAKSAIAFQQSNESIKHARDAYIKATQAGDTVAISKYADQLQRLEKTGHL